MYVLIEQKMFGMRYCVQNIESFKFQKTRENPPNINVISIALNLTNSTQWKLRWYLGDFHEFFTGGIYLL